MIKKIRYQRYLSLTIGVILILLLSMPVCAQEAQNGDKSVVFLLDVSGSMKSNDPERLAVDGIAQLIYSLPTNFKTGLAVYGTEAAVLRKEAESSNRSDIVELAGKAEYQGYSNAGAGLLCAVEMSAEASAEEKYIVMLSDGEILMKEDSQTQESERLYQDAIEYAKEQGIVIHVIGLGEDMEDMNNPIYAAASATGGKSCHSSQAEGIQSVIDGILEEMGVKQSTAAIVDADGGTEKVVVELPYLHADKIRVLLTGSAPIHNLSTAFQAESAIQVNGVRFALLEIEQPSDGHLEISFEGTAGSQVRINAIPEYYVFPQAEVVYEDRLSGEAGDPYYERTATIRYTFCSKEKQSISLWEGEYFDHSKINLRINGEAKELTMTAGTLEMQENVTTSGEYEVAFDYSGFPVNVIGESGITVSLEAPPAIPAEEPEPKEFPVGIAAAGMLLLLAVIVLILYLRRPKPVPVPEEERPQPSKYHYVGKVNIYITRTRSGYDIPPLYYNLFRLPAGKVISLEEILKECDVEEAFPGAENIFFKPGTGRSLILTNNSDCTIIKSREILMKNKSYQLALDAKVDVAFEDEISELTLQYKDLKPSEMWQ